MGDRSWIQFYFSSGDVLSACHGFILSWVTAVHQLNPKSQINCAKAEHVVLEVVIRRMQLGLALVFHLDEKFKFRTCGKFTHFTDTRTSQKSVKETQRLTLVITENSGCQESRPKPTDRFLNYCGAAIFSFLASKSSVFFQRSNLKCRAWRRRLSGNCLGCCWPATTTTTKKQPASQQDGRVARSASAPPPTPVDPSSVSWSRQSRASLLVCPSR